MIKPIRIALRLPDSGFLGSILLGALRAAHARNWTVSLGENSPEFMLRHGMKGIIGAPGEKPSPAAYAAAGIKFIGVLGVDAEGCLARVSVDHVRAGTLAGEHLLECGFRHFGFVGYPSNHGTLRRKGFEAAVAGRAQLLSDCPVVYPTTTEDFDAMFEWLKALPKPVGVFAADDPVGAGVTEVCHLGGIRIPADVAVVSVNDDGVYTAASVPELSSVRFPWERIGQEAVSLLASHITPGEETPRGGVVVPPTGISVRGSSDVNVIGDAEVAAATAFIRQNFSRQIGIDDVSDATTISRRLLERRFKASVGRTLLEQIQFIRIEQAKKMLSETALRVSDIVRRCGFGSRAQFHRVFQISVGATPDQFRRKTRDALSLEPMAATKK